MKQCWILLKCVLAFVKNIMLFLSVHPIYVMNYIYRLLRVKLSLYLWNESNFVMMDNIFVVCSKISFVKYFVKNLVHLCSSQRLMCNSTFFLKILVSNIFAAFDYSSFYLSLEFLMTHHQSIETYLIYMTLNIFYRFSINFQFYFTVIR